QVKAGAPVTIAFDQPVKLVWLGPGQPLRRLAHPRAVVAVGKVASGAGAVGSVTGSAAARSWEHMSRPVRVTWFPAQPYPQLLVHPRPGVPLAPGSRLQLTFSSPFREVLGSRLPVVDTPGGWRTLDDNPLAFRPKGPGFPLGSSVTVRLPRAVHPVG